MDKFSTSKPKKYVDDLAAIFALSRDPDDAVAMEKYMKHQFDFYGIKSEARHDITRAFYKNYGMPAPGDWKGFALLCWEQKQRELQYVAMELIYAYRAHWEEDDVDFFEFLITHKSWWDTVDFIASNIIGSYMKKFDHNIRAYIHRWKRSDNMWLNRTAILFQLKYREETDFKLMVKMIEAHKDSEEFFLQKAIGWALRQHAKYKPKEVRSYVKKAKLKPLSEREALKNLK